MFNLSDPALFNLDANDRHNPETQFERIGNRDDPDHIILLELGTPSPDRSLRDPQPAGNLRVREGTVILQIFENN
jgi:hypothetical protein